MEISMNITKNKLKVYIITALVLTVATTALHTILMFGFFDRDIGYFQNSVVTSITAALALCSILWFFTTLLFIPKNTMRKEMPADNTPAKSAYIVSAFLNAFGFLNTVFDISKTISSNQLVEKIQLLYFLFFALSVLYFVGKAFKIFKPDTTVFFGFFVIFNATTMLAQMYFDNFVQMNNPLKITMQIALLFIMIYFLGDLRFDLKKPYPRLYLAVGISATLACLATSIPHIIAYFADILSNKDYFIKNIYILICGLYILTRTILYVKHNLKITTDNTNSEIISE
jgi:hypothetical protein